MRTVLQIYTFIVPYGLKTDKKIQYLTVLLPLLLSVFTARAQNVIYVTEADIAHNALTESRLQTQIQFLSDSLCAGRGTGTPGGNIATLWLAGRFRALGLRPVGEGYAHRFSATGGRTGRNVVGLFRGSPTRPDADYVILAASYDGLGTLDGKMYPGADSNASGVAALLGLAEMFGAMRELGKTYRRNILFVALDGKNLSLGGSDALWKEIEAGRLADPETGRTVTRDRITAFVNIDQVGSTFSPLHADRPDFLIMLSDGRSYFQSNLSFCNERYGIGLDLGFDYYGSRDFTNLFYTRISDQKVFLEHNIPSVMFTSGITMNNNKTYDTPSTLDLSVLLRRVRLMFHWVERIL